MSTRGRALPEALKPCRGPWVAGPALRFLLIVLLALPFPAVARGQNGGDNRLKQEARRREAQVLAFVPRLVAQDDLLISQGLFDPLRHRRLNRLIGMGDRMFSAGYESTAVAAATLDLLRLDPVLAGGPLAVELAQAADYAMQALVARVPGTSLNVGSRWRHIRAGADFDDPDRAAPGADIRGLPAPLVSPTIKAAASDGERVLLELPSRELEGLEDQDGFAWIPGSHLLVIWGPAGAFLRDGDTPRSITPLGPHSGYRSFSSAASGEYLAGVRHDPATGGDILEMHRLGADTAAERLDAANGIDNVVFPPLGLGLAWRRGDEVVLYNFGRQSVSGLVSGIDSIAAGGIGWSPDGRRLAVVVRTGDDADGGPWSRLVFDGETGERLHRGGVERPWPVVWTPDSRSLTTLEPSAGGGQVRLTPVAPGEADDGDAGRVVVHDVPAGQRATHAVWAPDGGTVAIRIVASDGIGLPIASRGEPGDFIDWRTTAALFTPATTTGAVIDPPAPGFTEFAWHPSGRWYAAGSHSRVFGTTLWLSSRDGRNAFPVGRENARTPRFSSDGRRLAFLEDSPGGARLVIQDIEEVKPDLARSREEAAAGEKDLTELRGVAAVRRYRNAARLAPGVGRHHQGLGQAYALLAAGVTDPWHQGYYAEGAARAFASAAELLGRDASTRLGFLESMGRRAILAGRRRGSVAAAGAEKRLKNLPHDDEERAASLEQAAIELTEARLWDPWNEYARTLHEGVLVRLGAGTP